MLIAFTNTDGKTVHVNPWQIAAIKPKGRDHLAQITTEIVLVGGHSVIVGRHPDDIAADVKAFLSGGTAWAKPE